MIDSGTVRGKVKEQNENMLLSKGDGRKPDSLKPGYTGTPSPHSFSPRISHRKNMFV
jgi:hypothetical protein